MAEACQDGHARRAGDEAEGDIRGYVEPDYPSVRLDDVDRRLLLLLNEDSSRSQRSLANDLGVSAPTVGERLARLTARHVIEGRGITVNWSAVGYPMTVIMPMVVDRDTHPSEVVAALKDIPELVELLLLTGSYDMMARFQVRSHRHLQSLLFEKVWPLPGLLHVETMISLGTLVRRGPLDVVVSLESDPGRDPQGMDHRR